MQPLRLHEDSLGARARVRTLIAHCAYTGFSPCRVWEHERMKNDAIDDQIAELFAALREDRDADAFNLADGLAKGNDATIAILRLGTRVIAVGSSALPRSANRSE